MTPYGAERIADTIDLVDVVRSIRRQWRAVIACLGFGMALALAVVLFAPRRFEGRATVLARPASNSGTSISGRMTGLGELLGGVGTLGSLGSGIETELQVLRSRYLAGRVVDSLMLQVRVTSPSGLAPRLIVSRASFPGSFKPRVYEFAKQSTGTYQAEREGAVASVTPGQPAALDDGSITLRPGSLPERFTLSVLDREDAITRFGKRLTATKAGGDIARVVYRTSDSLTAAEGANALLAFYVERRRTTDRGVNERRVDFVSAQFDSTSAELTRTERELRQYQESSGVLDAEVVGQVEAEAAAQLRRSLTDEQVNEGAIKQLLAQASAGRITSRDLAAYPLFMHGSSISPLVSQLSAFETQRAALLERRTERDPEVQTIDQSMRVIEANIIGIARSYASAVTQRREQLQARLDSIHRSLMALPAAAERGGRLQRDVKRLSAIHAALEAQLVEARLAAIGEGGEIKQMDVAVPSREPSFPRPLLTMALGTSGGLLMGLVAALLMTWFGRWFRDPVEIERAMGVVAQRLQADAPLLMAGAESTRTLLVVPLDRRARPHAVIDRLVRTARQRAVNATLLDLSGSRVSGNGNGTPDDTPDVNALIERMEREHGAVIVLLPSLASDVAAAALRPNRPVLLIAPPGPVDRTPLGDAVATLRRLQVPCAGVILSDDARGTSVVG